jgi:hypothetical protein
MPITVSGFGTGALTMTNTDQAEFNRVNQAAGVGKDARPGVDSNLGLQATAKISDSVSFTAQGLVRKNGNNDQFGAEPGPCQDPPQRRLLAAPGPHWPAGVHDLRRAQRRLRQHHAAPAQ